MRKNSVIILLSLLLCITSYANQQPSIIAHKLPAFNDKLAEYYQQHRWSVIGFYGQVIDENLGQIFFQEKNKFSGVSLYGLGMAYTLDSRNAVSRFFSYVYATPQLAVNLAYLDDPRQGAIFQINPYFAISWMHWPWNKHLITTVSVGDGISYATKVPYPEYQP